MLSVVCSYTAVNLAKCDVSYKPCQNKRNKGNLLMYFTKIIIRDKKVDKGVII
jgi:hypothetical protein